MSGKMKNVETSILLNSQHILNRGWVFSPVTVQGPIIGGHITLAPCANMIVKTHVMPISVCEVSLLLI